MLSQPSFDGLMFSAGPLDRLLFTHPCGDSPIKGAWVYLQFGEPLEQQKRPFPNGNWPIAAPIVGLFASRAPLDVSGDVPQVVVDPLYSVRRGRLFADVCQEGRE